MLRPQNRTRGNPESKPDEDDLSYTLPTKPSELRTLGDDELFELLRRVAFANAWRASDKVQFEAMARNIAAIKAFKRASDRTGSILIVLTVVLVGLTAALIWLTTRV